MTREIWVLRAADKRNLSLIPHDLNYFQAHFVGKPMANDWKPPLVKISGKSLRLRDFVSWMIQSPVVSERAKACLEPLIHSYVEFLPLVELKGTVYYAMNVLKLVDCLDRTQTEMLCSSDDSNRILSVNKYHFHEGRIQSAPIFKVPDYPSDVFVMQSFVEVVIQSKLTGAKFADSSVTPWASIMRKESCNIVPGVMD